MRFKQAACQTYVAPLPQFSGLAHQVDVPDRHVLFYSQSPMLPLTPLGWAGSVRWGLFSFGGALALPGRPTGQERQEHAGQAQGTGRQKRLLIGTAGAVNVPHGRGAEKSGQSKADEHNAVVDTVVPRTELICREAGKYAHERAKADADDRYADIEEKIAALTAEEQVEQTY